MCFWAYSTHFSFLLHSSCSVPVLFESFLRKKISLLNFEALLHPSSFPPLPSEQESQVQSLLKATSGSPLSLCQGVCPGGSHIIGRNPSGKDFEMGESKVSFPAVSLRKQGLNSSCAVCQLCDLGKLPNHFSPKVRWWLTYLTPLLWVLNENIKWQKLLSAMPSAYQMLSA